MKVKFHPIKELKLISPYPVRATRPAGAQVLNMSCRDGLPQELLSSRVNMETFAYSLGSPNWTERLDPRNLSAFLSAYHTRSGRLGLVREIWSVGELQQTDLVRLSPRALQTDYPDKRSDHSVHVCPLKPAVSIIGHQQTEKIRSHNYSARVGRSFSRSVEMGNGGNKENSGLAENNAQH
ncbi:hypothetical protein RRG08_003710 [Elysia crispata]|uniref:Uncharacterized protein n=1 Tax=Elysia crispata TaxID=231223 RepID=A0AAE1AWH9_9GAST|nr:hypothetical protein RRG08_003710 [Elysia crispata]